jgi:murein L,D-transpeptidase YcbB/YkuD
MMSGAMHLSVNLRSVRIAALKMLEIGDEAVRPGSVRDAMQGDTTRHIALAHPIPVLILYGTAFAMEDGKILLFDDLYGHDAKLAALLGL